MADLSDQRLRALYEAGLRDSDHLDEVSWEGLACGDLSSAERERFLRHIAGCPECGEIHAALERLAEEIDVAGLATPGGASRATASSLPRWRWGLAAAALLALALAFPWRQSRSVPAPPESPAETTLRAGASPVRPVALSPLDTQSVAPQRFLWRGSGPGWSYRVELLDAAGEPLWRSQAIDATRIDRPAAARLEPGRVYYWRVVATPFRGGPAVASRLASFSIAAR